ncbi:MAG TPA: hypothetical protein VKT82_16015 [Ktedonobacterales bacterium]|nr:hypothetical protein [Ktedonobacterales bacterium]
MDVVNVTRMEATTHRDLVIGLDCDGVLASGQELWEALFAAFPDSIPNAYSSLTSYDWPRITPETTELCLRLSADAEFTRRFSAMPDMASAIRILHLLGWEIHIITARPAEVHQATHDWLYAQKIGHLINAVHCTEDKAPLAMALGCGAFVEDNLRTAEKLGALGMRSYLMNASYNQAPLQSSIRTNGWRSLLADLLVYQCALQPWLVQAARAYARRTPERSRSPLADLLSTHSAEPQTAA